MDKNLLKGCLVWLWNNNETDKQIGILADVYEDKEYPEQNTYYALNGFGYKNCEPVEYKDVMFYNENPMKQVYLTAKEKAAQGIVDAVDEYFKDVKGDYEDELPNYVEGMRANKDHFACGESDGVVKAIEKYMELV